MPGKESLLPPDWFDKGNRDVETIELLLAHGGDPEIMASHRLKLRSKSISCKRED